MKFSSLKIKHLFSLLLVVACFSPLFAHSACTSKVVDNLFSKNLDMRLRFVKAYGLMPTYEEATTKKNAKLRRYIEAGDWDSACKGVFGLIEVADDVLAGGNGKGQGKVWDKCTPEKMLSYEAEYDLMCDSARPLANCNREELTEIIREMVNLKAKGGAGQLPAKDYVNRMCEIYSHILKVIR